MNDNKNELMAYELLKKFEVTQDIKGFGYLVDLIAICAGKDASPNKEAMELYKKVAAKNNTSVSRCERSVRRAIERAFCAGKRPDKNLQKSVFGSIYESWNRPTVSQFVYACANYLKYYGDKLLLREESKCTTK